jgi:hypothetical protein
MAILEFHKVHIASAARGIGVLLRYRQAIAMRTDLSMGVPVTTAQEIAGMVPPSSTYPQAQQPQQPHHVQQPHHLQQPHHFQQPHAHSQPWDQTNTIPPPNMGTWMMGLQYGMEEDLGESWLTTQDWGQQNWVLEHFENTTGI